MIKEGNAVIITKKPAKKKVIIAGCINNQDKIRGPYIFERLRLVRL
jgi:hypothetical protein